MRSMRIAFLIAAHHLPEQLARLARRLANGRNALLIHVDRRTPERVYREMVALCAPLPNVSFLTPRRSVHWADFSQVEVQLAGMRTARQRFPDAQYVAIISGQCYPLLANEEIERRLRDLDGASWIESHPMPVREWSNGMEFLQDWHFRIGRRWIVSQTGSRRLHHKIMQLVLPRRPVPQGLTAYKGSAYFVLERRACDHVLAFAERRRDVARYFRFSFASDEMFVQSILGTSTLPLLCERTHYIRFSGGRLNPDTLTLADIGVMRESGKLFARKFDTRADDAILGALDHDAGTKATRL